MPRDREKPETPAPRKRVSVFVKLFVLFHLIAITCWSLPPPPKGKPGPIDRSTTLSTLKGVGRTISDGTLYINHTYIKQSPTKFYLLFSGFWQYWDMFSPNPSNVDFYGTATITYRDGSTRNYNYPRIYTMPLGEKYISERYRKYYERAHNEDHKWLWPKFAQRVALLNYDNPANPPVKVVLTRNFFRIPMPPQDGYEQLLKEWQKSHPGQKIDASANQELWVRAREDAVKPATDGNYVHYNYYTHDVDLVQLDLDKAGGLFQ